MGVSFNREIKEAQNAGYYVGKEKRLSSYLMKARPTEKEQEFYFLYTISTTYPNYALTIRPSRTSSFWFRTAGIS